MRFSVLVPVLGALCFSVSGCNEYANLWRDRYGPPSVHEAEDVAAITKRQMDVMKALAQGANLAWPAPIPEDGYWYKLTLMGFNAVDDQCTAYLEDLFGWERKRNRTRDILALGAATAASVLGITNASQKSLVLTAQAFGFASGAWTIVADSYLYKISPATISSIEFKLQAAYRETAAKNRNAIDNGATAYQYLRGYLTLCLPVTIENKVSEYLAATKGEEKPVAAVQPKQPRKSDIAPAGARFGGRYSVPATGAAATPNVGLAPTQ